MSGMIIVSKSYLRIKLCKSTDHGLRRHSKKVSSLEKKNVEVAGKGGRNIRGIKSKIK